MGVPQPENKQVQQTVRNADRASSGLAEGRNVEGIYIPLQIWDGHHTDAGSLLRVSPRKRVCLEDLCPDTKGGW